MVACKTCNKVADLVKLQPEATEDNASYSTAGYINKMGSMVIRLFVITHFLSVNKMD